MSDLLEQIAQELQISLHKQANTWLTSHHDAFRVVDECERRGVVILGIDAFWVEDCYIRPDLIADYSELATMPRESACREAAKSAREFLTMAPSEDLWFELVLDPPRRAQ